MFVTFEALFEGVHALGGASTYVPGSRRCSFCSLPSLDASKLDSTGDILESEMNEL